MHAHGALLVRGPSVPVTVVSVRQQAAVVREREDGKRIGAVVAHREEAAGRVEGEMDGIVAAGRLTVERRQVPGAGIDGEGVDLAAIAMNRVEARAVGIDGEERRILEAAQVLQVAEGAGPAVDAIDVDAVALAVPLGRRVAADIGEQGAGACWFSHRTSRQRWVGSQCRLERRFGNPYSQRRMTWLTTRMSTRSARHGGRNLGRCVLCRRRRFPVPGAARVGARQGDDPDNVPNHSVCIQAAGASAGSITAALAAVCGGRLAAGEGRRPRKDGQPYRCVLPALYQAWVTMPDMAAQHPDTPDLLATNDLKDGRRRSRSSMRGSSMPSPTRRSTCRRRPKAPRPAQPTAASRCLTRRAPALYLTLSNMRGVPISSASRAAARPAVIT